MTEKTQFRGSWIQR